MEDGLVSLAVIAKVLNLSERRVQQLVKEGILPKPIKGKYRLIPCVQAYIKYLQERAYGKSAAPQDTHLERARLLKAQADKTELEVAVLQKSLIPAEEVESTWLGIVMSFRARMLALPSRYAAQVVAMSEAHEAEKLLKGAVYEALTELANQGSDDDGNSLPASQNDSVAGHDAAAGDDSQPVGGQTPKTKPRGKRRARKVDH